MAKRAAAGTLALAVCLTGGAALASSAQAATGFTFDTRLAGADRYMTAVEASKAAFPDGSDSVVIVNGDRTVDGLTASYVAGLHSAPILYVNSDGNSVSTETAAEIVRLKATKAYIVGGTTVVSASLEAKLKVGGGTVIRYGGVDRFETASLVAGSGSTKPSKVFVASGERFADALVAGPVAYKQHYPILLTSSTGVPSYTKAALADISAKDVKVVGGTAVVSASTYTAVGGTVRLAGDSRQGTATELADDAIKNEGFSKASVALVGNLDRNAADALVAAPFAGENKTPLLFIDAGYAGAPTDTYLKAHAADLTGKGYVFGGTTAVPTADVDDATKAAVGVSVSVQGFIVTGASNTGFSYADAASQSGKKITFKSTDKYSVSGSAATQAAFVDSLKVGATVSIATSADGVATYGLTPVTATTYSSGLLGTFDTALTTLSIWEPITGTPLPFLSAASTSYDYTTGGSFVLYTVDGQTVSKGIFDSALSVGDSVSVTGTGADLQHIRTVALTSGSVTGTVASVTGSAPITALTVKSTAGATFTVPLAISGDSVMIDGTTATAAAFTGSAAVAGSPGVAAVASPVSVGDQVTYSKAGGVQKFTLVNAAPSKLAGTVSDTSGTYSSGVWTSSSSTLAYWSPAGNLASVSYSDITRYVIDGTIGSNSDFVTALTAGDTVVYQPADATTNSVATLTLTSKPLAGSVAVGDVDSATHKVTVLDADNDAVATTVRYDLATSVYSTGTGTNVYTLDGATVTLAQFDAAVNRIQTGARQGTIQASVSNGTVTWALATTAFTSAPAPLSITKGASNAVVVTFNKPVTAAGTAASTDWNITGAGTATAVAWSANKTVATFTGTAISTGTVTVAPVSAAKAALYTDTYGTAVGTSGISATF